MKQGVITGVCKGLAMGMLLLLCFAVGCQGEEAVWAEETFFHLEKTVQCDNVQLVFDADLILPAAGTLAREYHLSRLSGAYAKQTALSVDWAALGFPVSEQNRWISDASSYFTYTDTVSAGVYTFCELTAENREKQKGPAKVFPLIRTANTGFLGGSVDNVFTWNHLQSAGVPPLSACSFDKVKQYAEYVAGAFHFQLGAPAKVRRWDGTSIGQLLREYENYGRSVDSFTDADLEKAECYDVSFPVYWQGLRLHSGSDTAMKGETVLLSMPLRFILSGDGALALSLPVFETFSPVGTEQAILSWERAVDLFVDLYNNLFLLQVSSVTVKNIALEYVAISGDQTAKKGFTLYPAWCIQAEVLRQDGITYPETKCFHAVTGRQLK